MAVKILSPTSQLVNRSGGVSLAWAGDYPQAAYEVLYRRAGQTAWNTLGRVESGARTAALDTSGLLDGVEYHYRVVCYSEATHSDGDTDYTGSDTSPAYSLILAPDAKGMLKVRGSTGMVEVPLYDDLRGEGPELKVRLGSALGRAPLVERGHPMATPLSLRVGQGVLAAAGRVANCQDPGVPGETDLDVRKRYYEAYQYQHSYEYSYQYQYQYTYMHYGTWVGTGYVEGRYLVDYYGRFSYAAYGYNASGNLYFYNAWLHYYGAYMQYITYYYYYYYSASNPQNAYAYQYANAPAEETRYHYAERYYHYAIRA